MNRLLTGILVVIFSIGMTATFSLAGEARTISGTVFQKGEKRPLSGITVYVEENDEISATTGSDGKFSLTLPEDGEYNVSAVGVGFEKPAPVKIKIDETNSYTLNVFLVPATATMNEIIVTAERNRDRVSKIIITGKTLEIVPGAGGDPLKAITKLPGITSTASMAESGAGGFGPAIRGTSPEDNQYYVDNFGIDYLFHMGGMISIFNADLVEDFNLFAAAYSSEFGDGIGGVIDVKLREPRTDRMGYKLQMGMFESDFLVEGPLNENQSFYVAARRSYIDLVLPKTGTIDESVDYTIFPQFWDYQTKYVWRMSERNKLTFSLIGVQDEIGIYIKEGSDAAKTEPAFTGTLSSKNTAHVQFGTLETRLSPTLFNKLTFGVSQSIFQTLSDNIGSVKGTGNYYWFKEQVTWKPNQAHDILTGIEYGKGETDLNLDMQFSFPTDWDPNFDLTGATRKTYIDKFSSWGETFYIKDRWKVTDNATLILGGRQTYSEYFESTTAEPRLAFEYDLNESTLLTAGWGKYHQEPEGPQIIDVWGNPELDYMHAEHTVAGIEKEIGNDWSLKAEVYYKSLSDLVIPDPEPDPAKNKNYIHGGSGTATGVEMLARKRDDGKWFGWVSLSYSESKRKNDYSGEELDFKADQPVIANLVYSRKLSNAWTVGTSWRYQTGSPYTPVTGATLVDAGTPNERYRPIYGELNSERTPDFHQLDVRIDRDWLYDTWKYGIYFDLTNVYFRENVAGYTYNPDYSERTAVPPVVMPMSFGIKAEF
ncbi:MAG: TonB-dependent receptor [Nitrospinota bacterium]|nr:TonB-dependent receptor [Nitrospinota bacterium]